jgi:hypothetical protein
MPVIVASGRPTSAQIAYARGDAGVLQNAAKEAALADLAFQLQRYAVFSFDGAGEQLTCTATVRLADLPAEFAALVNPSPRS